MDLIRQQRATVAEHIRLENEQKWSEVPRTMAQDSRAFYDSVPVGHFKGIERCFSNFRRRMPQPPAK
jgi:hypothetical protein